MVAWRPGLVGSSVFFTAGISFADIGEHEGNYEPEKATHRSDFVGIVQLGATAGGVSGYPNEASKIDREEFRADTGFGAGTGGNIMIGVALRDWFTFAVGLNITSVSADDKKASGTNFVVRGETFPLFYEGGAFRDLGVFAEVGAGGRSILDGKETVAEGGFTSVVGGGVFFEPLKLGFLRAGPSVQYVHEFSTTLSAHLALAGLRLAYYAGP